MSVFETIYFAGKLVCLVVLTKIVQLFLDSVNWVYELFVPIDGSEVHFCEHVGFVKKDRS